MNVERTYRDILKIELADRVASNPAYSLRALAKQINVAPSLLSDVLKGKKNLSPSRAAEVAQALKFDEKRVEQFSILAEIEQVKSAARKAQLLERLDSLFPQRKVQDLSLDVFKVIYDWYHLAILELTMTTGFELTKESAAERLGITVLEAENAILRLLRLELLTQKPLGKLVKTNNSILAASSIPNDALRNYHQQLLGKAADALRTQTPQEKFIGSETFAFDEKHLKEANKAIEECFEKIVALASMKKTKREVYHLGIQFFRLTKKEKSK